MIWKFFNENVVVPCLSYCLVERVDFPRSFPDSIGFDSVEFFFLAKLVLNEPECFQLMEEIDQKMCQLAEVRWLVSMMFCPMNFIKLKSIRIQIISLCDEINGHTNRGDFG